MNAAPYNGPHRRARTLAAVTGLACLLMLTAAGAASAAPAWTINSLANTTVAPGATLDYLVETSNVGDVSTDGSQITVTATLPAGTTAVAASLTNGATGPTFPCFDGRDGTSPVAGASSVVCLNNQVIAKRGPDAFQKLRLTVRAADPLTLGMMLTTAFSVSGGGAPAGASAVDPTRVAASPPGFGLDAFDGLFADSSGDALAQAGGHPVDATVSLDFNTITNSTPVLGSLWPVEPVKDVLTDLPAGLVGNPTVADQCTLTQLANNNGTFDPQPLCPPTSQVGTTIVRLKGQGLGAGRDELGPLPVFNLVPPPGVPAAFAFNVEGIIIVLDGTVRTGGDPRADGGYGISVDAKNLPEALAIIGTTVTFWGVPSDPSHDGDRMCPGNEPPYNGGPTCTSGAAPRAFLRMPTSCTASANTGFEATANVDSWVHPGAFQSASWFSHDPPGYPSAPQDQGPQVGITGCDRVPFDPTFTAQPSPAQAGGPVGFSFDLALPQTDDPSVTAESDLRSATVTLPAGVRVNPSSADGLQGCSPAQIALGSSSEPACPEASKMGTVTIDTPLLRDEVTGGIYLATPFDNPSHSLIALYLTASADGVVLKIPGTGTLNPTTGQITTSFDNNPQLPFSRLHLELFGGPRAALALPDQCGTYTGQAVLIGWNNRTVVSNPSFTVSQNADGQPCPSAFSPGLSAGTASNRAGSSSSLLLRVTRGDGDQELNMLTVDLPGGLTGRIANVPLCADAQAAAGTCSEVSRIGDVTVGAGAGSNPFFITTGRVYLTGPYKGAPFGASIVVPAVAGPFDLGNVVVRSSLSVDKHTANVRIVSDPLPTILQGIPLDVRDVRVNVDRPGFFLNPTSCAKKTIAVCDPVDGRRYGACKRQFPGRRVRGPWVQAEHGAQRRGQRAYGQRPLDAVVDDVDDAVEESGESEIRACHVADHDQRTPYRHQRRVHSGAVRGRHRQMRACEGGHRSGRDADPQTGPAWQRLLRQKRPSDPGPVRGASRPGRIRSDRSRDDPRWHPPRDHVRDGTGRADQIVLAAAVRRQQARFCRRGRESLLHEEQRGEGGGGLHRAEWKGAPGRPAAAGRGVRAAALGPPPASGKRASPDVGLSRRLRIRLRSCFLVRRCFQGLFRPSSWFRRLWGRRDGWLWSRTRRWGGWWV